MERRRRFWSPTRLLITAAIVVAIAGGCQVGMGPGSGDDLGTLRLVVDSSVGARLIQVTEYPVTSLQIEVTGPDGVVIQAILWLPEEGRKVYEIPGVKHTITMLSIESH